MEDTNMITFDSTQIQRLHVRIFMGVYTQVSIHTGVALLGQLPGPRSNDPSNSASAHTQHQVLVPNTVLQSKKPGRPGGDGRV